MSTSEGNSTSRPDLSDSLIDLREQLTVWLLAARADLRDLGRQSKYTRAEAARLAECGAQTVRDAISAGKLKTGSSGWITHPQLIEWLGYDPIQHRIEKIIEIERNLALIDAELEGGATDSHSETITDLEPVA